MKSRYFKTLFLMLILMIIFSISAFSAEVPIPVYDWEDLDNVRNGLDLDYILMNDLDELTDGYDSYVGVAGGWTPIGEFVPADIDGLRLGEWDADFTSTPFTGSFDGNGQTISGLIIDQPDAFGLGLFGYIRDAQVANLNLVNADITGHRHIGIVTGYSWASTMSDITTSGTLFTHHNGGGLAGTIRAYSVVQNCSSTANVEGDTTEGGSLRTGGLIGAVHTSTVQDSSTNSIVRGDSYDTGGLAGSIYGTFLGDIKNTEDLYNIDLYVDGSHIIGCHTSGTVYGNGAVGGLIGSTNQASVIEDCYTTGDVIATGREIGGLIGNTNYFTQVKRSYATGDVTGNGSWVGGLVGIVCNYSVVEQSFATGNVSNGKILTGGLVGHLSTGAEIHDSFSLGNVIGIGGGVGGLVGSVEGVLLNIKDDPSDDVVLGATILRSYSTGSPAGPWSIGGLLGDIREGTVTSSYWDIETSGIEESLRGEGRTSDAMLQQSNYLGWGFGSVWDIVEGLSYPFFTWQGNNLIPYFPNLIAVNDNVDVQEDSTSNLIDVLLNDIVTVGDPLEITDVTAAVYGTVVISDNKVSYTPVPDFEGFDSFSYTVTGGNSDTDSAMVFIRVNNVNDLPVAMDDAIEVSMNSSDNVIDVLANDTDIDEDILAITAVTQGSNGTVAFTLTEVTYTPNEDFFGEDSFTYTISDGNEGSDTATVTVTVTNGNNVPTAVNDVTTVNEDSINNVINVLANDTDLDNDTLTVTGVTQGLNGSVTYTASNVSYTPDTDFSGTDSFTYTISDGNGGSDTATVTVTVLNINDAPVAIDDVTTVNEDSINNVIDVLANDSDLDGDTLTVTSVTQGSNGSVTYTASNVSYTPAADFYGTDSFTYTISDGNGGSDTATVTVTVKRRSSSGGGGGVTVPEPEIVVTTESTLQSTVNSTEISSVLNNGSASADISTDVMEALLDKAEGTDGNETGDTLEVVIKVEGEVEGVEINLQSTDLNKLVTISETSLKLSSPFISMTFDHEALKAIDDVDVLGEITIKAREVSEDELSESDQLLVKGRPVFDLSVIKGDTKVTSFGEGLVSIEIPYEPAVGENLEAIVVYFLSDQGELQMVTGRYDDQLKSVVFETNHFSKFVIGYNPVLFIDVPEQAWYKNAVDFIAARGIGSGTGGNKFEPEAQLKRADFVVMLMNTYASALQNLNGNQQISNFNDAGDTYYTDELLTAKRLGLISGTGQNLFEPELEISRQEMMVILHNMLKAIGEVPAPIMNLPLAGFNDADQVADWAEEAIASFVNSGIVVGYNYNLNPEEFMTRAEISQILFNLLSR